MVISKSIITELPVMTGEKDAKGHPVVKMVSMLPAYGCCLVFESEEAAIKMGAMGPFETIDIGNDFESNPGLKILH